jgi:hypothetical protein
MLRFETQKAPNSSFSPETRKTISDSLEIGFQ